MKNFVQTGIFLILFAGMICQTTAQTVNQAQKDSILNSYVTLPNSDIQIVPPAYFKPFIKDNKFGFMHEGAGASISIEVLPGTPYTMLVQGMTKENLESQGVKLLAKEDVKTRDNKDATIFLVSFVVKSKDGEQDLQYERMMLFTGDYNRTIWINANYPVIVRKMLFNVMKESLLSVRFD